MALWRRITPVLIAVTAAIAAVGVFALRQGPLSDARTFPETGHTVREPFLSYFDQHGSQAVLGYPLADAYTNDEDVLIQPFQNVVLQMTVRGVEPLPIGVALGLGEPATRPLDPALAQWYAVHGGVTFFGKALTDAHEEHGTLVQDFERARIVQDAFGNVGMARLGEVYTAAFPPPPSEGQAAIRLNVTPTPPNTIVVNVGVGSPMVNSGDEQSIFLLVEEMGGGPVVGAQALAVLEYNPGVAEITLPETDENGVASTSFITPPAAPGSRVTVRVHVLVGATHYTVETAYMQWW